jgi:hypothetical protein
MHRPPHSAPKPEHRKPEKCSDTAAAWLTEGAELPNFKFLARKADGLGSFKTVVDFAYKHEGSELAART